MLYRFITRSSSHFNRFASSISPKTTLQISPHPISPNLIPRTPHFSFFSTNGKNGNFFDDNESANSTTDLWKLSSTEADQDIDAIFSVDTENIDAHQVDDKMSDPFRAVSRKDSSFSSSDDRMADPFRQVGGKGTSFSGDDTGRGVSWKNVEPRAEEEYRPWSFTEETKERSEVEVFGIKEESVEIGEGAFSGVEGLGGVEKSEKDLELEMQEKALTAAVKGPDRAFGDLIAASGITDDMLDSLIALKEFEDIEGLPSLAEIEDLRYERTTKKSSRAEIERQKQEAAAKGRVREVDEKGRAYGTGKRKCSIARVWINPGEGKFIVNDKEFDVYFPMIDHRAALLRPFSETKTLGLWDVNCTVKGGGTSGQVGAIRLGISRALQNWEPGFRPPLKEAGFLTRDSRIVERKKPGKAKARKSFQWVKR